MSKYLILYRHGIAEDKETSAEDDLRSLSARGKNLLKKSVSGFKTMIESYDNLRIFSSPTLRAKETAEMLAVELEIDEPTYREFLGTGSGVSKLRGLLKEIEPGEAAIVVGQQPYLSLWSQEISGTFLRFKKGTAACFKFPDEEMGETKAELLWYLQTREFVKINDK
ncbi:SixA phosphatase family protein [Gudongella oleilytica]|jgi:phosphohistidine phosphatase SixA|uniref:SixA phosphatase family protein n=1 Tax=Gudongella oleilytica TaxID=1582259 RepID=UPI000FF8A36D|nr:histidine phosphatase family protein [Gudongella oleilytica]MDD3648463.1 histidine phosphatase family protein [Candidatus Dojkabacteria bacterium]